MRTKKLTIFILTALLVIGLTACNVDNDRNLTRSYTNPNNLTPYNTNNGDALDYSDRNGTYNRYGYMDNYNRYDRYNANRYNTNRYNTNRYNTNRFNTNTNTNAEAERMANVAARVNGVDDATVVIAGRTAYVGLDLKDKVQTRQAANVERDVYRKLQKFARGYNISITSDADLFGRLRDIGDGMRTGTPLDTYQNDFRTFDNRFRTNY